MPEPTPSHPPRRTPSHPLPRPVLAAVIALPLLLAVAAAVAALVSARDRPAAPLPLAAVPAPAAGSADCAALLAALPDQLPSSSVQLDRRELAEPAPQGAAAWGTERTAVLRCGMDRPAELTPTAALLEVNGVRWLRLAGEATGHDAADSTWVAVDRPVYVAFTLADDAGTGPLQEISTAVTRALAQRPVRPSG